jgi:transposase-like protein
MLAKMTSREFTRRMSALGPSKAEGAARDVLVHGSTVYAAAKAHGLEQSTVHRLVKRLENLNLCSECGQPVKPKAPR